MTEEEWKNAMEARQKLAGLDETEQATYRKLRLLTCACCRLLPEFLESLPDRESVLLAEREADGQDVDVPFPDDGVLDIRWDRRDGWDSVARVIGGYPEDFCGSQGEHGGTSAASRAEGNRRLCNLIDDIVGNPFRPVSFDPAWRSEAVVGIARGIYDERAFERMPILADALQEAGCEHPDILSHCREPGEHVRGCRVVDLVLGKS